jgi:hypothetical protein
MCQYYLFAENHSQVIKVNIFTLQNHNFSFINSKKLYYNVLLYSVINTIFSCLGAVSRDEYFFEGPKNRTVLSNEPVGFHNFWMSFCVENPKINNLLASIN